MALNLSNAKPSKNKTSNQSRQPQTQPTEQLAEQQEAQPLALPSQAKVLAMQAITATKEDMAMIDRVMAQRKAITLQHFDSAMAKCNQEIEDALAEQLPGEDVADFLQSTESWEDIEAAFKALLTPEEPDETEEVEPEATEETPIDAAAVTVEVMPVELAA